MKMYKEFCHLSASCSTERDFKFELPSPSSLESVVNSFMLLSMFSSCSVRDGRGVLCHDELKCLEVVSTGFIACELDRFLYHHYPVDKVSHSLPKADLYVCERNRDGTPGSPMDMKLEKLTEASKETAAYCVKAMEVYSGKKTTTVNLGLAMTMDRAS